MTLRTITFDDEQWQVVPREPTEDMLLRGYSALMAWDARTGDDYGIREVFLAMLAAAPEPPAQQPMTDAADPDAIVAPLPVPEVGEERQAMIDQLRDQAIELDMLREALGVPYEPHQSLLERMLEAARGRAGSGAAPEPPAQEPMTVAEIEDQSSYWHRWYLKTREELYAVRQGWIRVVDEFLVTRHLGIARPTDTYDEARAKLLKIIDFEIDIATDPVVGGDRVRKKVPMTDEEAKALISPVLRSVPAGDLPQVSTGYFIAMMRAVERHHGIGKGESNEG